MQALKAETAGRPAMRGRVYLIEDGKPRAVNVRLGISDGAMTELIVGTGSDAKLVEGADTIVGTVTPGGAPKPSGPRMSF